ncbi:hypothetical protein NLJ89_g2248 [Agrocybe chaxingu]|uniref:DUF6533 domain-containing protein n=1 Tax=Agrocybe chaxingu TaxID=84603 RepID=A0A9W8MY74_9AGAR|nr:hypothetical protein NLJ89_g2248 [Agrocybe chaxingu]
MVVPVELSPENEEFIRLYKLNLVPLKIVVASLTWVLHDYLVTVRDEVRYIWVNSEARLREIHVPLGGCPSISEVVTRLDEDQIRYYTIVLVIFDALQIHSFAIPGVPSKTVCVAIDPVTRLVGGISLWSVEIIMQLRIYALFNRSRKVALFNGVLFILSIVFFIWIMIINTMNRYKMIQHAMHFPLPGCPTINGGTQWAQLNKRLSLTAILLSENTVYFLVIAILLIFNNLMVIGATKIPWFGFGPFHGAVGILTCRMLIHLRKFTLTNLDGTLETHEYPSLKGPPEFAGGMFDLGEDLDVDIDDDDQSSIQSDATEEGSIDIPQDLESTAESSALRSQSLVAIGEAGPSRVAQG